MVANTEAAKKAIDAIIKFEEQRSNSVYMATYGGSDDNSEDMATHLINLQESYKEESLKKDIEKMLSDKSSDEIGSISTVLAAQKDKNHDLYVSGAAGWVNSFDHGGPIANAVSQANDVALSREKRTAEEKEMEMGDNPGSVGVASSSVVRESDNNKPKVVDQTAAEKEASQKSMSDLLRDGISRAGGAGNIAQRVQVGAAKEESAVKDAAKEKAKGRRDAFVKQSQDFRAGSVDDSKDMFGEADHNLSEAKRKLRDGMKGVARKATIGGGLADVAVNAVARENALVKEFNKLVIDNDVKGLNELVKNNPDFTVLNKTMAGKSYEKESVKEAMNQGSLSSEMNQFLNSMKLRDRIALGTLDSRDLVANLEAVAGSREIGDNKGKEYPAFDMPLPGVNKTALHYAAEKGRFELVDDMIDLGAKKDPKILEALVASGDEKGVRKLLNRKFKTSGPEFEDIPRIDYDTKQEYKGAERLIAVMNTPIHELKVEDQNVQRDIQASQYRHTGTAEFRRATRDAGYAAADAGRFVSKVSKDAGNFVASGATSAYNKLPTKETVGKGAVMAAGAVAAFVSTPFIAAGAGMVMFYNKALKPMGSYTLKKGAIGVENARWAGSRAALMASNISEDMSRKVTRGKENFSAMQEYREFGRSADSAAVEGKQLNDKLTVLGSKLNSKEERDQFNEAMVSYDQNEKALINLSKNLKKNRGEMSAEQMEQHKEEFAKATEAMGKANQKFSGILNEASKTNPSLKEDIGKLNEATKKFEYKLDALEVKALDFDKRLNDRNSQDKTTQEARDIKASNLWNASSERADEYRDVNAQSLAAGEALADLPGSREDRPEFVKGNKVAEIDRKNLSPVDEEVINEVSYHESDIRKATGKMISAKATYEAGAALGTKVKPTKNPKMVGYGGGLHPITEGLDQDGPDVDIESNIAQRKAKVREAEIGMLKDSRSTAVISGEEINFSGKVNKPNKSQEFVEGKSSEKMYKPEDVRRSAEFGDVSSNQSKVKASDSDLPMNKAREEALKATKLRRASVYNVDHTKPLAPSAGKNPKGGQGQGNGGRGL